jgi:hypothetical protein
MRYTAVVLNASAAQQYHTWCACAQPMASQYRFELLESKAIFWL